MCAAHGRAIKITFHVCFIVGLLAFVRMVFFLGDFPLIGSVAWVACTVAAIIFVPTGIAFAFDSWGRPTWYTTLVITMMIGVALALVSLAGCFYMNGMLDRNPSVRTRALVEQKFIEHSRYGADYVLQVKFSWNGKTFDFNDLVVSEETFLRTEPGDFVRVTIHPGYFSLPWYSNVLPISAIALNAK